MYSNPYSNPNPNPNLNPTCLGRNPKQARTDGSGLAADGDDHYELGVQGAQGALLLDSFTSLRRTAPSRRKTTLVKDGGYGRKECVAALLAAVAAGESTGGEGEAAAAAVELITAREGRNAQRLVDAVTASGGEWVTVSYDFS